MNISGYSFEGPYSPYRGFTNEVSAVYAILDDQQRLLDVGQSDNLNNRFPSHPRQSCWEKNKNGDLSLYILQISNEQDRLQIESSIRYQYNPTCGER
jgi:excinuclease UvrABC nuclease subunit